MDKVKKNHEGPRYARAFVFPAMKGSSRMPSQPSPPIHRRVRVRSFHAFTSSLIPFFTVSLLRLVHRRANPLFTAHCSLVPAFMCFKSHSRKFCAQSKESAGFTRFFLVCARNPAKIPQGSSGQAGYALC